MAHAHRPDRSIRSARTESATLSSAYVSYVNGDRSKARSQTVTNSPKDTRSELAGPGSIIYESRTSDHVTVITPVAPKVLLAVTGSMASTEQDAGPGAETREDDDQHTEEDAPEASSEATASSSVSSPSLSRSPSPSARPQDHSPSDHGRSDPNGFLEAPQSVLEELESISEQLSSVLREEMGSMRWPEGA